MTNQPKTLIVVEGGRLEPRFFNRLKDIFGLNLDLLFGIQHLPFIQEDERNGI